MKWFKTFEDFKKSQDVIENEDINDTINSDDDSDVDNNEVVYIENWEKY